MLTRISYSSDAKEAPLLKAKRWAAYGICTLLFMLAAVIVNVGRWYGATFAITFRELMYTVASPLKGTGVSVFLQAAQACAPGILLWIALYAAGMLLTGYNRWANALWARLPLRDSRKVRHAIHWIGAVLCVILFVLAIGYVVSMLGIGQYLEEISDSTLIYEQHYVDPRQAQITAPARQKNLILLILESMETTYASEVDGGCQDVNYIPLLTQLAEENVSFSWTERMGGFRCITGTSWTMGALMGLTAGVPFSFPVEQNGMSEYATFATGLYTLGDLLKEEGYSQEFLCGSDASFAGRDNYFTQHGDYAIFDLFTAREKGYIPEDYYEWWGYEDQKLYQIARDELTRLHEAGGPFNFTLLTVDTHHVGGYVCELCGTEYETDAENVIACADRQAADFIAWCREQPFYEDTVIVIVGDHPRMDTHMVMEADLEDRMMYNCIINAAKRLDGERCEREFTTLDMFPTILSAMGYDIAGDRLGLGTDMFSGRATLSEQLGHMEFASELRKYSAYYQTRFK